MAFGRWPASYSDFVLTSRIAGASPSPMNFINASEVTFGVELGQYKGTVTITKDSRMAKKKNRLVVIKKYQVVADSMSLPFLFDSFACRRDNGRP